MSRNTQGGKKYKKKSHREEYWKDKEQPGENQYTGFVKAILTKSAVIQI